MDTLRPLERMLLQEVVHLLLGVLRDTLQAPGIPEETRRKVMALAQLAVLPMGDAERQERLIQILQGADGHASEPAPWVLVGGPPGGGGRFDLLQRRLQLWSIIAKEGTHGDTSALAGRTA